MTGVWTKRTVAFFAAVVLALGASRGSGQSVAGHPGPSGAIPEHGRAAIDGADARLPLPLTAMMAAHQKANMRDHLAAVQEIVAALAADDMPAIERAARRIGYSESMAQMCQHMGAGAPGFTEQALNFHRTADTIADAARRGDPKGATAALAATIRTCVGCHAMYRQEITDAKAP